MSNVNNIKNNNCTGCGGCSNICPVSAIKIIRDENGFFSPNINNKCIKCGLCVEVCYKALEEENGWDIKASKGYLSYSLNDDVRYRASSGGIGEELCKFALENGYKVCGVIYDYEKNIAKHIVTDRLEDIERIVGSKYIPSYTEDAFKSLDVTKKYIIIGTPCQIYSIRKFMQYKKINDWILVDFFCHGSPSLNLWDKYLEMIEAKEGIEKINNVNFRDKVIGWHKFSMTIEGNNKKYSSILNDDYFMNCFLKNVDLQEACYTCKLRFNKIYSDIRLGDFWGPKCSRDEKGISIVLTNTELGDIIFKNISGIYLEKINYEEIKASQYIEKLAIPREREIFQKNLKSDKYLEDIYKEIIIPIKKKERRSYYLKFPLRLSKRIMKKILRG
ncbi:Coenzyme F420 hydrogenase/dehydrogenase, beta subunit C-terminal domain [Clostridium perfringens]|uniref:Coenzyme F420 hydrogenase/dehydrogenase, beta subunit C-terminal domain n=1 Tax=Clostridium perfringens TaxID=1502 RepID=UPI0018E49DCA|nr:Coenzyme F420 hydrogenase/dehydrogenase, beta subunit C-terminal domain [Clostridium perfringens]MBI6060434.1 Coenzyme F420 hydrogenase/dehydrogenase, beta subunit C-terminal domain [Clostridium perfringens]